MVHFVSETIIFCEIMDTPLAAFAAYKTMKPSVLSNITKKKKKKAKRKNKNKEASNSTTVDIKGAGDFEKLNGHTSDDRELGGETSQSKRKKKSKHKPVKKVKFLSPIEEEQNERDDRVIDYTENDGIDSSDDEVINYLTTENNENLNAETEESDVFEIVPSGSGNLGDIGPQKKSKNSKKKKKQIRKENNGLVNDSVKSGEDVFKWIISPLSVENFMSDNWEKEPIYVSRRTPHYYSSLLSTPEIDTMLRNNNILFGKNVDVTSYSNGERETHNPIGRAMPHVVWDFYKNKCSIRLLNPQTYCRNLHAINAMMQEYLGCFVGANAYLTPPDSQGFAPHFDDIEAFILQIEGQKKWKVYKPRSPNEELPRFSSRNLVEDELDEPVLEVTLKAGDLLYFPRGYIHQGCTDPDYHSLHVTISVYQRNSFADLLQKVVPAALLSAIKTDIDFRRGLPLKMMDQFGVSHKDVNSDWKQETINHVKALLHRLVDHIDLDTGVDSIATSFMHDALPPVLTPEELKYTVDSGLRMTHDGTVINRVELDPKSSVKFIRHHCCRLVCEEGEPDEETGLCELESHLYYTLENSLEYHGNEPQFLVIPDSAVNCVITLINSYPKYVKIEDLTRSNEEEEMQVLTDLWERGLLLTEEPLVPIQENPE